MGEFTLVVNRVWNFVQTKIGFLPEIVVVVNRSGGQSAGFFASHLAAPRSGLFSSGSGMRQTHSLRSRLC